MILPSNSNSTKAPLTVCNDNPVLLISSLIPTGYKSTQLYTIFLVVEARAKSGSLITVEQALEQNKDVYVIPGRVGDSLSEGCNELIKSGAYIMTKAEDILECDRIKNKLSGINGIPEYLQKLESVSQFELATPKNMVYSCL